MSARLCTGLYTAVVVALSYFYLKRLFSGSLKDFVVNLVRWAYSSCL
ncbi:hypothetical protein [Simonsiella muelleri]|nr:hypothetical protein [Simonsiella muelleri]